MTGTELAAANSVSRSWLKVRQATAATCRDSTRAMSAGSSPRPAWVAPLSMTSG